MTVPISIHQTANYNRMPPNLVTSKYQLHTTAFIMTRKELSDWYISYHLRKPHFVMVTLLILWLVHVYLPNHHGPCVAMPRAELVGPGIESV